MSIKALLYAAARPNFVKIAPIWRALVARGETFTPRLVHTGQHYDHNMSDVFFADLGLPQPHEHLGVGSGSHAEQTAGVMVKAEALMQQQRPDCVLVVGDVNATVAVSLAAAKLLIPVVHVEAGLRSGDLTMPEEINRLVTDRIADLLLTPSPDGNENLRREGVAADQIVQVGNVMIDSLIHAITRVKNQGSLARFGLTEGHYGLVTLHRPANVDDPEHLRRLLDALVALEQPLLFPVHPRTRKVMEQVGLVDTLADHPQLQTIEPVGYDDFLNLMLSARFLITDSGGIQEETTYLRIPCLTMRPNTERPITITEGTNELVTVDTLGNHVRRIVAGEWKTGRVPDLWDGKTAERIADSMAHRYG
jgi:UDP-N-acetylglucosamine 2-epimerase (non-hydrolysing)